MKLRIKDLRTERGLTIDQVAALSGLSRGFISLLENGKREPSADTLAQLADAFGVSVVDVIDAGSASPYVLRLFSIASRLSQDDLDRLIVMAEALADRQA